MAEYIKRETLKEHLYGGKFQEGCAGCDEPGEGCIECIVDEIDGFPAADVAPVRRGHWVRVGNGTTCSECMQGLLRINGKQSEWVDLSGMPYCPNCGAKMDKEEESCKINPPSI